MQILTSFVNFWLLDCYTNIYLLTGGLQNPDLRKNRFTRPKG